MLVEIVLPVSVAMKPQDVLFLVLTYSGPPHHTSWCWTKSENSLTFREIPIFAFLERVKEIDITVMSERRK